MITTRPIKQVMFGIIVAAAMASVGFLAWTFSLEGNEGSGKVVRSHAIWATDVRDDRKLVGYGDSVFFGQVLETLGQTEERGPAPLYTKFSVKVLEVLKGSADGVVTVRQRGGYREGDNALILTKGDQLLEPGKSYLFVTRDRPQDGLYALVPVYGDLELEVPKHAKAEEVLSSQHAGELRRRFTTAIEHQIPFDPKNP